MIAHQCALIAQDALELSDKANKCTAVKFAPIGTLEGPWVNHRISSRDTAMCCNKHIVTHIIENLP
jgi:hypothetical protein